MANTYVLLSSVTVGAGGASSIDFTSIPATYTDLCLVTALRSNGASGSEDNPIMKFNGSSTSYTVRRLIGNGSSASSASGTTPYLGNCPNSNTTANTFGNIQVYIPNYAGGANKSFSVDSVQENNTTSAYAELIAGLWSNTSAITQITITPAVGTAWVQYTTAYLYGIKNS